VPEAKRRRCRRCNGLPFRKFNESNKTKRKANHDKLLGRLRSQQAEASLAHLLQEQCQSPNGFEQNYGTLDVRLLGSCQLFHSTSTKSLDHSKHVQTNQPDRTCLAFHSSIKSNPSAHKDAPLLRQVAMKAPLPPQQAPCTHRAQASHQIETCQLTEHVNT